MDIENPTMHKVTFTKEEIDMARTLSNCLYKLKCLGEVNFNIGEEWSNPWIKFSFADLDTAERLLKCILRTQGSYTCYLKEDDAEKPAHTIFGPDVNHVYINGEKLI